MSLASVRAFLALHAPDVTIIELETSTATVALAAEGHGVSQGQIAKSLSLRVNDRNLLVVAAGTARLDNKKAKAVFGGKVRACSPWRMSRPLPAIPLAGSAPSGGNGDGDLLRPVAAGL